MSQLHYTPSYRKDSTVRKLDNASPFLLARTANQCIQDAMLRPVPRMLFSELWHEGELCILFADTNLGKSILAVQIADAISRGEPISGFKLQATAQPVLYFDFEMSEKQFEKRCSQEYENHYLFDNRFLRLEVNPNCTELGDFETMLFAEIKKQIGENGAKVLIIDNLTYLNAQAVDTAKEALPLMKKLKELKIEHDLSILVLAHTPKRSSSVPITVNDLSGSRHLANFADSIFAIGASSLGSDLRYIKQIKARATEMIFGSDNVVVCEIGKPTNFLRFEVLNFGHEVDHLKLETDDAKQQLDIDIVAAKKNDPNLSDKDIAEQLGTYRKKVYRVLKKNQLK